MLIEGLEDRFKSLRGSIYDPDVHDFDLKLRRNLTSELLDPSRDLALWRDGNLSMEGGGGGEEEEEGEGEGEGAIRLPLLPDQTTSDLQRLQIMLLLLQKQ